MVTAAPSSLRTNIVSSSYSNSGLMAVPAASRARRLLEIAGSAHACIAAAAAPRDLFGYGAAVMASRVTWWGDTEEAGARMLLLNLRRIS